MNQPGNPSAEMRPKAWKPVIFLAAAVVLAGGILAGLLLWNARRWTSPKPAAPPVSLQRQASAPAPVLASPPEAASAPRQLSWEGLSVKPYRGRYQGDYPVQKVVTALEQDLADAIKDLKDGAGLYPTAADRVIFEPRDGSECAFRGAYGLEGGEDGLVRVGIPLEPLVLKWYPARSLLAAALAEAILVREAPGFAAAPPWLRHGMALYLSKFGEFVERRTLLEAESPPMQNIGPLSDSGDMAWAAGYWAFRSLCGRGGDAAVKKVADAMRFNGDWQGALRSSGETPEGFDSAYRAWAKAHLRGLCANREEFLDMVGLLRREEEREALQRLALFLREQPLDLYAGDAKYFQAYALYRTEEYDEALRTFTDLLNNSPYTTSRQAKAHFFLGRCYQLLDYPPLAEEQYVIARTDPASALLSQMASARLKEVR